MGLLHCEMMCDVNSVPGLLKDFKFDLGANFFSCLARTTSWEKLA